MSARHESGHVQLAVDLTMAAARITRLVREQAPDDLPPAQWRMLSRIDEMGPLRISDLAAADRTAQPTVTALVKRLAESGWVRRHEDPDDRRATRVEVTEAGRVQLARSRKHVGRQLAALLDELDTEEVADLAAGVRAMRLLTERHRNEPRSDRGPGRTDQ